VLPLRRASTEPPLRSLTSMPALRWSPDVAEQEGASTTAVPVWPSLTPSPQLAAVCRAPPVQSRGTTSPAATSGSRGQSRAATSCDASAARVREQSGTSATAGAVAASSLGSRWDWEVEWRLKYVQDDS
jgi:hypothetical protein